MLPQNTYIIVTNCQFIDKFHVMKQGTVWSASDYLLGYKKASPSPDIIAFPVLYSIVDLQKKKIIKMMLMVH